MIKYLAFIFLSLCAVDGFSQFVKDETVSTAIRDIIQGTADWGDYDNDGDLDLVICGVDGALHTEVYRNDGGAFTLVKAGLQGLDMSAVHWGDFDNDNDLDLLLMGVDAGGTSYSTIYRNDDGNFVDHAAGLKGFHTGSSEWGDFDNDGDLDIALIGKINGDNTRDYLKVYKNESGAFTQVNVPVQPTGFNMQGSVSWGDFDNDSDLDLLVTGLGPNVAGDDLISTIIQNNNGTFEASGVVLPGIANSNAVWGDYDQDGNLDIAMQGVRFDNSYFTSILRNDGAGVFTDSGISLNTIAQGMIGWEDFDRDGDEDLLLMGLDEATFEPATHIYSNNEGVITETADVLQGIWGSGAWGDYDGDGDQDLLLIGVDKDFNFITDVYKNTYKLFQTITFAPIADKIYGDNDFTLTATSSSGLAVNYDLVSGPAQLAGNEVAITGVGEVVINATQAGDTEYNAAESVQQTFTINKATLTVNADDKSITYGDALPALTLSYTGFVNNEGAAVLNEVPTISTPAGEGSDAGTYTITLSGGTADNYEIALIAGQLTINKAPLTARADDKFITYGDPLPELTYSYTGFVNGEDATVLNTEPAINTPAGEGSDAGTYAIAVTGGNANNYEFNLINAILTINKAVASIFVIDLEHIYDGLPKQAIISTDPENLDYVVTYNGNTSPPDEVNTYDLIVTINDINYEGELLETFSIMLISGHKDHHLVSNIVLYPVPADLELNFSGDLSMLDKVLIYDLAGKVMLNESITGRQIDISHIDSGTYILNLTDDQGIKHFTKTILIK